MQRVLTILKWPLQLLRDLGKGKWSLTVSGILMIAIVVDAYTQIHMILYILMAIMALAIAVDEDSKVSEQEKHRRREQRETDIRRIKRVFKREK